MKTKLQNLHQTLDEIGGVSPECVQRIEKVDVLRLDERKFQRLASEVYAQKVQENKLAAVAAKQRAQTALQFGMLAVAGLPVSVGLVQANQFTTAAGVALASTGLLVRCVRFFAKHHEEHKHFKAMCAKACHLTLVAKQGAGLF